MNKIALSIVTVGLLIGIAIIFLDGVKGVKTVEAEPGQNIEIREGVQYITINAKGGYSPRITAAAADMPTKLIVKTNGTYDCSTALVIRSVGYQKILSKSGEEVIDIGTSKSGASLQGTCSMGMYNFVINFS